MGSAAGSLSWVIYRGVWVRMRVSITYANATSTIADQSQAQARGTDTGVATEARTGAGKTRGTESVTRKCADKKVPGTAIYTGMVKRTYVPKDTVIAKGTDNRAHALAHAHSQKQGTDTIIDTKTGTVMGQGR